MHRFSLCFLKVLAHQNCLTKNNTKRSIAERYNLQASFANDFLLFVFQNIDIIKIWCVQEMCEEPMIYLMHHNSDYQMKAKTKFIQAELEKLSLDISVTQLLMSKARFGKSN